MEFCRSALVLYHAYLGESILLLHINKLHHRKVFGVHLTANQKPLDCVCVAVFDVKPPLQPSLKTWALTNPPSGTHGFHPAAFEARRVSL